MPLKIFGKQAKQPVAATSPHTFLCLMFVNRSTQAALWRVEGEEIVALSQSSLLSFEDDEDGLIKIDQALQELGPESENVNQVLFGFDPHWVNANGLNADKKTFIKSVTENLELQPVGFVVIADALVQQILSEDSMASEVLVYIQEDTVFIFLLKQGKLVDQLSVGRSEDIVQDIVEGLARFAQQLTGKDTYLPAKLMLASPVLSTTEVDDAQQQIANYNWSDNHPFVQAPVVESMVALDVLQAVVKQGGIAVAESKGLRGKQAKEGAAVAAGSASGAEDFGFANVDSPIESGDNFEAPESDGQQVTSFGVPINQDILPDESDSMPASASSPKPSYRPKSKLKMPKFISNIQRWYANHPHKKAIRSGALSGLAALVLLLIGWAAFAYRVVVSAQLAEAVIAKDLAIVIDPTASQSDPARQILKASLETTEVSGSDSLSTTGVTLEGERAAGTVNLFNKTTAPKTFVAGTPLSTGSVAFTLNDEVTVASASSEDSGNQTIITHGQTEAAVTASEIGAEGNIGGGTELTVDDFSLGTYSASAKETFSGGSSREVRVVAEEDQQDLLAQLTDALLADAAKQFSDQSGNGVYYALTNNNEVIEANYSAEVDEEADQLTLELTLEASAAKYNSADIWPLLQEALKDDIPEGYALVEEEPEFLSSPREEATDSGETVTLDVSVKTKARPPFDQQRAIDVILGLSLEEAINRLVERPEIEQATYTLRPGFSRFFVSKMPNNADRVIVEISNE